MKERDAIIIGAGAAGLAAAWELSQSGHSAIVIEARQRIGGRIYTLHDRGFPVPTELGAEFVHGEAPDTFAIIRSAQLMVAQLPDFHYRLQNGKLATVPDFWQKVDAARRDIRRRLKSRKASDFSFAEFLERSDLHSELRQLLSDYAESYHAAHLDRLSARSIGAGDEETEDEEETRQFRILEGNDSLVHWLRRGLDPERIEVRLNTIATAVRWKKREVTVECRNGSGAEIGPFRGRALIITVPLGVWKAKAESPGALRFDPELSTKERAAERLESGNVFKMVMRFRRAFWEEDDFIRQRLLKPREEPRPLNFLHGHKTDVPVWWSSHPVRAPILTGWAGGPKAESLLSENESTQVDRSIAALSSILSVPRRKIDDLLESWATHDWRADPFSRGAYSYVGVGGVPAQRALGKPVEETIFIAGEATNAEETGTVSGAIGSGRRAARELLRVLRS